MYTLAVTEKFDTSHYLIGDDWGEEGQLHTHNYQLELQLEGEALNTHGYLIDIDDIKDNLKSLIFKFQGKTLNELREFEGLNPSIENFARILCQEISTKMEVHGLRSITVKLCESAIAWASYRLEL
jgi:6-pyruvoyltetrahydropterin/6-carboxytetrahydropterin synthase